MKIERYRQIAKTLISELHSGKYDTGDVFPIRSELARRFKTTRSTVNRAMEELISKGYLTARRGAGTVVASLAPRLNIAYVAPDWLMHYMPRTAECSIEYFAYEEILASLTAAKQLARFDGIIWSHPEETYIKVIRNISKETPGILINRMTKNIDSVMSEYVNSFSELVSERLARYPEASAVYLSSDRSIEPHRRREEGFIKACREHKRFYENIRLPEHFASKSKRLEESLNANEYPLLIFADDWAHTGALIAWAKKHGRKLGEDTFYVDFDNTEPEHVWGIITTSIVQDFDQLTQTAFTMLINQIRNSETSGNMLIAPQLRRGTS